MPDPSLAARLKALEALCDSLRRSCARSKLAMEALHEQVALAEASRDEALRYIDALEAEVCGLRQRLREALQAQGMGWLTVSAN